MKGGFNDAQMAKKFDEDSIVIYYLKIFQEKLLPIQIFLHLHLFINKKI
jgi:hypothetical protein